MMTSIWAEQEVQTADGGGCRDPHAGRRWRNIVDLRWERKRVCQLPIGDEDIVYPIWKQTHMPIDWQRGHRRSMTTRINISLIWAEKPRFRDLPSQTQSQDVISNNVHRRMIVCRLVNLRIAEKQVWKYRWFDQAKCWRRGYRQYELRDLIICQRWGYGRFKLSERAHGLIRFF